MQEEEQLSLGVGSVVIHPSFGKGVVVSDQGNSLKIYFLDIDKAKDLDKSFDKLDIVSSTAPQMTPIDLKDIESLFVEVMFKYLDPPINIPLGNKWLNGKLLITPGDPSMQSKEIPIEQFFNKIIMLRDRLRVLEQNINTHEKLDHEDRIHLQQYITRIYGTLTTFNLLFKEKEHQFKGAGGGE